MKKLILIILAGLSTSLFSSNHKDPFINYGNFKAEKQTEGEFVPNSGIGVEDALPSPSRTGHSTREYFFPSPERSTGYTFKKFTPPATAGAYAAATAGHPGSGPFKRKKVNKAPSVGTPQETPLTTVPVAGGFSFAFKTAPVRVLQKEETVAAKLTTIEKLFRTMALSGIKQDTKFENIRKYVEKSAEPLFEANKIIKDMHARMKGAAKEKLTLLQYLVAETRTKGEHFLLPEDVDPTRKESLHSDSPTDQLDEIKNMSPLIFEYAGNNAELTRLDDEIRTALKDTAKETAIAIKDKILIITILTSIQSASPTKKLITLRDLHAQYVTKKRTIKSPVRFSPEAPDERFFTASPDELKIMHG